MWPKQISKADLLELENRINKEQQEARHGQNTQIQNALIKVDEALTENKLTNKSVEIMNKEIKELKTETKEWFDKISEELKEFIKSADSKYATKNEINSISKIIWTIGTIIITAIVWAILKAIWLY